MTGMAPTPKPTPTVQERDLTGAEILIASLKKLGVTDVFGLPGGAILPTYDPLMDAKGLRHYLVRHEQGAGHAAEGYATAGQTVGVCLATSGPGATNLVTAIGDAYMDSVPLIAITGQVFSTLIGTDAFQEADIVGITMPITKHAFLVRSADEVAPALAAAYEIASTGRPGPVLVDISKDAQQGLADFSWPPQITLPGYHPATQPHGRQVQAAAQLLANAQRPVLYVGGGVIRSGASAELKALAEATKAPVVTTLMARGAFPDSHPQNLGMPGMHGTVPAVLALQQADLIVSLGARFDDRVTGNAKTFAPLAKVVHVDIDPAEISKIRHADVPIVGDLRQVLDQLVPQYEAETSEQTPDLTHWWEHLNKLREDYPLGFAQPTDGLIAPQHVIQRIGELTGPEAVYAVGVGQHQMWAAQFIKYERPNSFLNSGGAGTMGYGVPAAMGAKVAQPDRVVWAIDGDGCFQMTNQELATCVLEGIPIKVAIINNSSLGMVKQWQSLFYDKRFSNTELHTGHDSERVPDFVKLAEAYGCAARRVESEDDVDAAIEWALSVDDRPVVIDFVVSADAMVWPMVPQGVSNDFIQYAKDESPAFEGEE
ncbi:acetolactate synthase large subunit [Pseudoclavibacter sp. 13-3]|uniref:acetolactate synthase large subunit n=1 Tax=Pseudoclavibacter sp. 13-3 TaxID=2901228 RepID=UPI003FA793FC